MTTSGPYPDIQKEFDFSGVTYKFAADVVHTHLMVELLLNQALVLHLSHPGELVMDRMPFGQKVNLVFAMGILPHRYKGVVQLLNSRRNKHAHTLSVEITDAVVSEFEQAMRSSGIKWNASDMRICQLSLMLNDTPPTWAKIQDLGRLLAVDIWRTLTDQFNASKSTMPNLSPPIPSTAESGDAVRSGPYPSQVAALSEPLETGNDVARSMKPSDDRK